MESLNTVMDDNKVLTLANNERVALTPEMKLLFEVDTLREATPATVSRAGILYINAGDFNWESLVTSWVERRPNIKERGTLSLLFEKFIPSLEKKKGKTIIPIPKISFIQQLCVLLEFLFVPVNFPPDCPAEQYENFFAFAAIWAFGSAVFVDGQTDYRLDFSNYFKRQFDHLVFPKGASVFDVYVDPKSGQFVSWTSKVPGFDLDPEVPLRSCLVHTASTISLHYFLSLMVRSAAPCMLVGPAGSGKTLMINEKLSSLGEPYISANISLNFYDSAESMQRMIEKHLEKKSGKNYGPQGNKTLIYFLDDVNMAEVDRYGTTGAHTIIKQHLDYGHWYCRSVNLRIQYKELQLDTNESYF